MPITGFLWLYLFVVVLFRRQQEKKKSVNLTSSPTNSFPEVRWSDPFKVRRVNYTLVPKFRNYSTYQELDFLIT